MTILRAALTQTRNAYAGMPLRVEDLHTLANRLDAIRDANITHNERLIRLAAERGARLICLSELCTGPYFALIEDPMWLEMAEDASEGPSARAFSALAAELGVVVVAPIYELTPEGRRFNTALVIDADGSQLGRYRKLHVPSGSNEHASFRETFYYEPSAGAVGGSGHPFLPVFETAVGVVGVAICYDRHFEGVVATLAAQGAELVVSPAVTFGAKSELMWPLEFQVDAARHRLFIGGSNREGAEPPWGVHFYGMSYFTGPAGKLEDLSDHPELVISDCDLGRLREPDPSGWDLARDRRPEAYAARRPTRKSPEE